MFNALFLSLIIGCGEKEASKTETEAPAATETKEGTAKADPYQAPSDVAAPPADAQKTASGLAYKVLKSGSGKEKPASGANVTVHYTGWTTDGKMFDSSYKRNEPTSFGLNQVIAGWTEGLQLMTVGEKTRFWIPEEMAYKGAKSRPQGMLVFDVELLSFANPPSAPSDVAAPPADAQKTITGLAYKVLESSSNTEKPAADAAVTVHYTGWTTDGEMFDSSALKGEPITFPLNRVIPGWSEAVQLMTIGEKSRFWIPENLAYKGKPGAPQGMLVFEIELLDIINLKAPSDVAAPPADAQKTASGLAYKTLSKGSGAQKPTAEQTVKVHYTGWTTDGKMFDSSRSRGKPAEFRLDRVIAGWTEGLQLMTVGDETRLWIPEELAYKGVKNRPAGMLVFDIKLLEIK